MPKAYLLKSLLLTSKFHYRSILFFKLIAIIFSIFLVILAFFEILKLSYIKKRLSIIERQF